MEVELMDFLELIKIVLSDEGVRAAGLAFGTYMATKARQVRADAIEMKGDFREMKNAVKELTEKLASLEEKQTQRFEKLEDRVDRIEQTKTQGG